MLTYAVEASKSVLGRSDALDEAVALSDATGIPVTVLVRALFNPETLLILARVGSGSYRQRTKLLESVAAPANCCSAFAAWESYTQERQYDSLAEIWTTRSTAFTTVFRPSFILSQLDNS